MRDLAVPSSISVDDVGTSGELVLQIERNGRLQSVTCQIDWNPGARGEIGLVAGSPHARATPHA